MNLIYNFIDKKTRHMGEVIEITEKEKERRRKISEYRKKAIEKKRIEGLKKYNARRKREKAKKEKQKQKEKELLRLKREKERERAKLKKKAKIGRPKKRGRPKSKYKKVKVKVYSQYQRNEKPPYKYKIVSCRNGKQNKFIGKYRTIEDAYKCFNDLKMDDRKIIFPSQITVENTLKNAIDEYILIEKSDTPNSLLRNEYGKIVEQKINIDGWIVLDKYRYQKEEEFWVWGYSSKNDRKTFLWIYRNILIDNMPTYLDFKRIMTYKNKVLIKDDNNDMSIIICKNESDAIRFYNKSQEWIKRDKIKQILFIGDYSLCGNARSKIENEIMEITGWNKKKVQMKTTTYYAK